MVTFPRERRKKKEERRKKKEERRGKKGGWLENSGTATSLRFLDT